MSESQTNPRRAQWDRKMDFFMASISSAIGLGNLWRFPYQCYKNGGGAFVIPFLLMVLLTGLPLVLSDITLGQYGRCGAGKCWRAAPIMKGIGWTIFALTMAIDVSYAVIVSYTFFYTIASMAKIVPWDTCGNWWNSPDCMNTEMMAIARNCTSYNGTIQSSLCVLFGATEMAMDSTQNPLVPLRKPVAASDEYFHNYVLQISSGITEIGLPRWPIVLCLLVTLTLSFFTLSFNVKTWGKMAYIFTLLPYFVMMSLLIMGYFYEGSASGILYFLKPRWSELAKPRVWVDAVGQAFYSLGCSGGTIINIASHNPFRNNCLRDALIVTLADTLTSLLSGVVVFAVLGQMSFQLNVPIDEAVDEGAGLAFVVYPTALASMPLAPVWSVFFMFMLFNLGVGTVVSIVASDQALITEELPEHIQRRKFTKPFVLLLVLLLFFGIGLVYTTNGGMYVLQMMDHHVTYILLLLGIYKSGTMGWIYGTDRFFENIETMSGWKPWSPFKWLYKFITPGLIIFVLVFNLTDLKALKYREFIFPFSSEAPGLVIVLLTLSIVPVTVIYLILTFPEKGLTFIQRIKVLCKPTKDWDEAEIRARNEEERQSFLLRENQTINIT